MILESFLQHASEESTKIVKDLPERIKTWRDKVVDEISRYEAQRERISLEEALATWKQIVVLGHPGSGKTTLLHHTALIIAEHSERRLPIYIKLRELTPEKPQCIETAILGAIKPYIDSSNFSVDNLLNNTEVLLLLDGFDEVGSEFRGKLAASICSFIELHQEI